MVSKYPGEIPTKRSFATSEREPDREFPFASGAARLQEVRDVSAGDQQQKADNDHEDSGGQREFCARLGEAAGGWGKEHTGETLVALDVR